MKFHGIESGRSGAGAGISAAGVMLVTNNAASSALVLLHILCPPECVTLLPVYALDYMKST